MTDTTGDRGPAAAPTREALREAVLRLVDRYSVDTIPADEAEVERYPAFLPTARRLYVGQPPGTPIDRVAALAERLHALGYRPIPQLAARELAGERELRGAMERFGAIGVTEALVVGGDRADPAGPFDSALALLGTGLPAENGITTVGVAGYPEGNRLIGPTALDRALAGKAELAAACGWRMYVVTQLSFDPSAVVSWIMRPGRGGADLPVHIGLPGLASLRDLIAYSRRCGVGASMRSLIGKASSLPDSARLTTTADLVVAYARRLAGDPRMPVAGARFFTVAGLEETVRWLERIRAGAFELTDGETSTPQIRLHA